MRRLAIAGDSHATHWFSALDALGRDRNWQIDTFTHSSCPFTAARRTLPDEPAKRYRLCRATIVETERQLLADPDIDTVFVSASSWEYGWAQAAGSQFADPSTDGFHSLWKRLTRAGKQVVVIRDVPRVKDGHLSPNCIEANPGDPLACSTTRAEGVVPDAEADAVAGAPDGVHLIDLTDRFCDQERCYAVVGDVMVYRDSSHLTQEYSTLLMPYLGRAFDAVDAKRG